MYAIYKPKHIEKNYSPSQLNTNNDKSGVAQALQSSQKDEPHYDGATLEDMRGNPLYNKVDDIDKIGFAQKKLAENGEILNKSKFIREVNRKMNHPSKTKK